MPERSAVEFDQDLSLTYRDAGEDVEDEIALLGGGHPRPPFRLDPGRGDEALLVAGRERAAKLIDYLACILQEGGDPHGDQILDLSGGDPDD
jgi:hypothetical protein